MKLFYGNYRVMLASTLLPWPLGHASFRLGGLAKYLFLNFNKNGRVFQQSFLQAQAEAMKIVDEKLQDPALSEHKDLLALFMNSQVSD
jgi:hypothetical protein